jgi:hypothetical protein
VTARRLSSIRPTFVIPVVKFAPLTGTVDEAVGDERPRFDDPVLELGLLLCREVCDNPDLEPVPPGTKASVKVCGGGTGEDNGFREADNVWLDDDATPPNGVGDELPRVDDPVLELGLLLRGEVCGDPSLERVPPGTESASGKARCGSRDGDGFRKADNVGLDDDATPPGGVVGRPSLFITMEFLFFSFPIFLYLLYGPSVKKNSEEEKKPPLNPPPP